MACRNIPRISKPTENCPFRCLYTTSIRHMGRGGINPLIPNFGITWMWSVSYTFSPHFPQTSNHFPENRRIGGPQSRSKTENLLLLTGSQPWFFNHSVGIMFTIPTELSHLDRILCVRRNKEMNCSFTDISNNLVLTNTVQLLWAE